MSYIELKNITKIYGSKDNQLFALDNVNLSIMKGEMIAIMGPSGSGKSTLLNIMGTLSVPTSGTYILGSIDMSNLGGMQTAKFRNKHVGFVVQNFALIDNYTVSQNIEIPMLYAGVSKVLRTKRIKELLNQLNISGKEKALPSELSGGQCQRVAIARALSNNPNIILADEPTGALDKKNGEEIMRIFEELNKEGKTIVIVTHNEEIAKRCQRIIYMEDGKIVGN